MSNGWTLERRQRQSQAIRRWRPWELSTGPKSAQGKAIVARNADRGGIRSQLKDLKTALVDQSTWLAQACVRGSRHLPEKSTSSHSTARSSLEREE